MLGVVMFTISALIGIGATIVYIRFARNHDRLLRERDALIAEIRTRKIHSGNNKNTQATEQDFPWKIAAE